MIVPILPPGVKPVFPLGEVAMTAEALRCLRIEDVSAALGRHARCDWGDLTSEEDAELNDRALEHGGRLFSIYHDRAGVTFWILTEADRGATTVLLPDDY